MVTEELVKFLNMDLLYKKTSVVKFWVLYKEKTLCLVLPLITVNLTL